MTHISIGLMFCLSWLFYVSYGRLLSASIVSALTLNLALIGLGIRKDPNAVKALCRDGDPKELLVGPLAYGAVLTAATLTYWRTNPIGLVVVHILCAGDGFAGLFGTLYGSTRLPWNSEKSVVGTLSFFFSAWLGCSLYQYLFAEFGYLSFTIPQSDLILVCAVTGLIESIPRLGSWDNLAISASTVFILENL
eukprot:TRINITY_DN11896_c0_g1_i1.p1 TRINITY_DN11896_c0_g1~~TRINITY_DN11896_c0_g1_i1.p1  ORF type:complete len:216 (+),score=23.56 TRINITY_DN11896_c0_g1_i1:70-648(+)